VAQYLKANGMGLNLSKANHSSVMDKSMMVSGMKASPKVLDSASGLMDVDIKASGIKVVLSEKE